MGLPSDHTAVVGAGAEAADWLGERVLRINAALETHIASRKSAHASHSRLLAAVEYSVAAGGKRLRPILVLETCAACGGDDTRAMPAALAVEFVHAFSLVHDDLPAMDDDDLRRGKPSNHKVYGEALAILAGDWLLAEAFGLLSSDRNGSLSAAYARALADGTLGMIEGQAADIEGQERDVSGSLVEFIHERKTARLIEACCRMGALCADAPPSLQEGLGRYGRHLGRAFQIADDLLDCTSSTEKLGKRTGKDANASKQTYPEAFGLEQSRARAEREINQALKAVAPLGAKGDRLQELARYVIARES
ncbi:MAG: polyprenyl synthetase family protein [Planctomycetes bacterium]|nr:polyprenyl synthetase family protein [Planctomycetota bacterium]